MAPAKMTPRLSSAIEVSPKQPSKITMATIKTNRSGACWFRRPGPDNISLELVQSVTSILKEFGYWHGPTAIGSICCGDEVRIRSWHFANVGSDGSEITHRQLVTRLLRIPFRPAVGLKELYKSVMIAGFLLPSDLAVPGGQILRGASRLAPL